MPPLVLHVIYRLAVGGLENGLVNLINHMPGQRYRHAIMCLTDFTDFRHRLRAPGTTVVAINKSPGLGLSAYGRVWKVIRQLKPAIVHTRNLPTLEMAMLAAMTGVSFRVHGEHGRDVHDAYGASRKFLIFRKMIDLAVHQYIAVSKDLEQWLIDKVNIPGEKVRQIYNGVDTQVFYPRSKDNRDIFPAGFLSPGSVVVGTVGRFQRVKDQATLIRGIDSLLKLDPAWATRIRVVMAGDGPLRNNLEGLIHDCGLKDIIWLPGERDDIPDILRSLDIFVLPSIAEGISNTVLEAMATKLPVIATKVGGNPELLEQGQTGLLIPPQDPLALAYALQDYLLHPEKMMKHGNAGLQQVLSRFSLQAMVENYLNLYDKLLNKNNP